MYLQHFVDCDVIFFELNEIKTTSTYERRN